MAKKAPKTKRRAARSVAVRSAGNTHGLDHDFIIIAGGGFLLILLILVVLYR